MVDHSFTLQSIMEIQKSIGQLTEAVKNLDSSIRQQGDDVRELKEKMSGVTHKLYAAGVLLAIALAIGGFIVDKAWDLVVDQIKKSAAPSSPKPP